MAAIGVENVAGAGVPHLDGFIRGAGGKQFAVWRPRYGSHSIGMPMIDIGVIAAIGIPHLNGFIQRGGGDALAIWRPRNGRYSLGMAMIDVDGLSQRTRGSS